MPEQLTARSRSACTAAPTACPATQSRPRQTFAAARLPAARSAPPWPPRQPAPPAPAAAVAACAPRCQAAPTAACAAQAQRSAQVAHRAAHCGAARGRQRQQANCPAERLPRSIMCRETRVYTSCPHRTSPTTPGSRGTPTCRKHPRRLQVPLTSASASATSPGRRSTVPERFSTAPERSSLPTTSSADAGVKPLQHARMKEGSRQRYCRDSSAHAQRQPGQTERTDFRQLLTAAAALCPRAPCRGR